MYVSFLGHIEATPIQADWDNIEYSPLHWEDEGDPQKWSRRWAEDPRSGSLEVWAAESRDGTNTHVLVGVNAHGIKWSESFTLANEDFKSLLTELE